MSLASQPQLTPQEYLAGERKAAQKHEYYRGGVFAMAGATPNHNRVVRNVITQLDRQRDDVDWAVNPDSWVPGAQLDGAAACPQRLMQYANRSAGSPSASSTLITHQTPSSKLISSPGIIL